MYQLSYLDVGENRYPYIIDLNVLEALQEEFQTLQAFEREIVGLEIVRDEEGHTVFDEEGKPLFLTKEPSVKAVKRALILMIREGLRIEAIRENRQCRSITDEEILADCSMIPHKVLAEIIHSEYFRRFKTKKE